MSIQHCFLITVCLHHFHAILVLFNTFLPSVVTSYDIIISETVLWSEQKGLDRGKWVGTPKGCKQHGLSCSMALVGTWGGLFCPLWQAVSPCMASILSVQGLFFSYARLEFPESPDWKSINWLVWFNTVTYLLRIAESPSGRSSSPTVWEIQT